MKVKRIIANIAASDPAAADSLCGYIDRGLSAEGSVAASSGVYDILCPRAGSAADEEASASDPASIGRAVYRDFRPAQPQL